MCLIFLLRPSDNRIIYPKREALKCDYGHGLRGSLKIQESQINLITQDWGADSVGGSIKASSQLDINERQGSQLSEGTALIWRGQFDSHSRDQAAYLCEINIQLGRKVQLCNHSWDLQALLFWINGRRKDGIGVGGGRGRSFTKGWHNRRQMTKSFTNKCTDNFFLL